MGTNANRYKNLLKNTGLFAIGSFGSKILSFIIVPFYTYVLTTSEYGRIDLVSTIISLILPFSTMLIHEAVIRFLPANEIDKVGAVSNSFVCFCFGSVLVVLISPVINIGFKLGDLYYIFTAILILNTFNDIFSNTLKAMEKNLAYSLYGILSSVIFLSGNVVFVLFLRRGIKGYFTSMLICQCVCSLYLVLNVDFLHNFSKKRIAPGLIKNMLRYSVPLIPNSLLWWVMNAGDKFVINYFLGDAANGIYSIALKVPTLISLVYVVFMSAWQISAIQESNAEDKSAFYTEVFGYVSTFMFFMTSLIIAFAYPVFTCLLSDSFSQGWFYVGLLSISVLISCFGTFFGIAYTITKKSQWAFITTLIGAIVNVIANIIFINICGLYGVAIGTIMGYVAVLIIRMKHCRAWLDVQVDIKMFLINFILLFIQLGISLVYVSLLSSVVQMSCLIIIIFVNRKYIDTVARFLLKKIKR